MTIGGDTSGLDPRRDCLANVDAFGRPVPTARFMAGREFDLLAPGAVEPSAAEIARVIADDVQVLPTFTHGVGPFPNAKGRWTKGPESLSAGERTAAVSLYLALVTRECMTLAGIGKQIIIEGPLARNRLFGEALARLTGVEVFASGDTTGTAIGAAMLFAGVRSIGSPPVPRSPLTNAGFAPYCERWASQVGISAKTSPPGS